MNLRWFKKADGTTVLQTMPVIFDRHHNPIETDEWLDVHTEEEPKKAREFLVGLAKANRRYNFYPCSVIYDCTETNAAHVSNDEYEWLKVREVIE